MQEFRTDGSFSVIHPGSLHEHHYCASTNRDGSSMVGLVITTFSNPFLILIPCIIDYVKINQLNALNYILLYFFTMTPTRFGKTMPSSGSGYVSIDAEVAQ
jgi:hypothetical protein